MRLGFHCGVQRMCLQPHGHAIFGTHHDVMWPSMIAKKQRPANETFIADQRNRITPIILERIQNGSDTG